MILASASPRRKVLLKQMGLAFEVHPSQVVEPDYVGGDPINYVVGLADLKAAEVADQYPKALVVGADTVVIVDDQVLGKPIDENSARIMLNQLSGKTHEVITAYSIQCKEKHIQLNQHVLTRVHFKALSQDEITIYIDSGAPFDKAGAYGIQDYSGVFVDYIEGCFYNVVGFPLSDFNTKLKGLLKKYNLTL